MKNSISRLRITGLVEGASFLILLFIAMPLKYLADMPLAVRYVGMAHGVLYILFCLAIIPAALDARWPLKRCAIIFLSALVPFGPFLIDKGLRRDEEKLIAQE